MKETVLAENYVSDEEMEDILADMALTASLHRGLADAEAGRYRIITSGCSKLLGKRRS
jgi:hypothetical protein